MKSTRFNFIWSGMIQGKSYIHGHIQQGNKRLNEKRIHNTQKPVLLYKWTLINFAKPGWKILDTHEGSGSHRIACYDMGFDHVGFENDCDIWQAQEERFKNHIKQAELFTAEERQEMIYQDMFVKS